MAQDVLYLVDANSFCYRAYFALKLSNSQGFPTGAIYGFYNMLNKIIKKYNPVYLGICFDVSKETFRTEKFKEYKSKRPPLPEGLKLQFPLIKEMIHCLGIKIIERKGYEADDVIASLASQQKETMPVVIISPDKDILQLVEKEKVKVYNPVKDKMIGEEEFISQYGFPPLYMPDYLSLAGDTTDNIPGAKGIGKVGAQKLIAQYNTIENLFSSLDKLPPKTAKIITEHKEEIALSKNLAVLKKDIALNVSQNDLKIGERDHSGLYKLFKECGFKKLASQINFPDFNLSINVKKYPSTHKKEEGRLFPSERIVVYCREDKVYMHESNNNVWEAAAEQVKDILENEKISKISYAFKNQINGLKAKNINLKGAWFDIQVAAYLIDSALGNYSLADLAARFLKSYFKEVPACAYPAVIYKVFNKLLPQLEKLKLEKLFFEIEMPLVYVLSDMEQAGVRFDTDKLNRLLRNVDDKISSLAKEIFSLAGEEFNLNSSQQLAEVFFNKLKIKPLKKTKTGFSTNEEVLTKLAREYKIAELVLQYRKLSKLKTTYLLPFIEQVNAAQGKVHAHFNQTKTQTGRLSSDSPNLQSIPTKGEFSAAFRQALIPSLPDGYILSADYSQIELRILAHFSEDPNLISAFLDGKDIHRHTAALIFGKKEDNITKKERDFAKRINFGIVYGMSSFGLARELGISEQEARKFINSYFGRYPKVKEFIERIAREARRCGYVRTIMGRVRYINFDPSSRGNDFSYRQAINSPIQGSAADLIKISMVKIFSVFKEKKFSSQLIMQIHDELVFDVKKEEKKDVFKIVKSNMEQALTLKVPLSVNIKIGSNWQEAKA